VDDPAGDMTPYLDLAKTRRPGRDVQRVNVDFPVDLLRAIDREARRIGVTRQAFIKLRLSDRWHASDELRPTRSPWFWRWRVRPFLAMTVQVLESSLYVDDHSFDRGTMHRALARGVRRSTALATKNSSADAADGNRVL
jgi:hypothetical protein